MTYYVIVTVHVIRISSLFQFKNIQNAYEILSDAQKREIYDNYGIDAVKDGGGGGGGFPGTRETVVAALQGYHVILGAFFGGGGESLFSSFFGDGLFGGGSRRRRKGESIGIPLE